jgi:hypothetical protein
MEMVLTRLKNPSPAHHHHTAMCIPTLRAAARFRPSAISTPSPASPRVRPHLGEVLMPLFVASRMSFNNGKWRGSDLIEISFSSPPYCDEYPDALSCGPSINICDANPELCEPSGATPPAGSADSVVRRQSYVV